MAEERENEVAEVTMKKVEFAERKRWGRRTYSSRVFCVKIMYERGRSEGGSWARSGQ